MKREIFPLNPILICRKTALICSGRAAHDLAKGTGAPVGRGRNSSEPGANFAAREFR